ncbi:MAG: hypothetical protein WAM73_18500 [Desulfobacterales bacterium]
MGICNQIGDSLSSGEHLPENGPMLLGWTNDSGTRLLKPALYPGKGLFKGEGVFENPRICPDPNECRQNRPAQANRFVTGKPIIPPLTGLAVK